ncbi:unnamed protein product [Rotaria magnacalcarata]|nr:unnamed protein product [Rotaria magnacalcarata]CAF5097172.1 unnamed protein product [Rotaria magnacalcarata]
MKQELVRTKSKISSLKREMSSIQQLHLAQQQVHSHLSASAIISPDQESHHHHLHPTNQRSSSPTFPYSNETLDRPNHNHRRQKLTIDVKNLSISSNDESLSSPLYPTTNISSSTQTPPLKKFLTSTEQETRHSASLPSSYANVDSFITPSDEQLRLYLTETLQREKDSAV